MKAARPAINSGGGRQTGSPVQGAARSMERAALEAGGLDAFIALRAAFPGPTEDLMSQRLENCQIGDSILVTAVDLKEKERRRLESMGILPGAEISVLARGSGPLLLSVGDSRVVLERMVARNIIVV